MGMRINRVEITNFRNITEASLEFSPGFNFITGLNAQGKTNLLEALYIFSLGRSFRTRNKEELISLGEDFFFIRMAVESDRGVEYILEVGVERSGSARVKINGERTKGFSSLIGIIPGVIFTPRDVGMASGPPGDRRSFIDYTAAQISGDFFGVLKGYRQVLKQRNAQIKETAAGRGRGEVMRALDSMLVERGEMLVRGRRRVLKIITDRAAEMFKYVFKGDDCLEMKYTSSINPDGGNYSDIFLDYLIKMRDEEIRRGYTIAGPHRDDIKISIGELNLRKYGSQGRKRLVAIVMKMAQASVIYEKRGERPVIMLDDIFSELDNKVSRKVKDFLSEKYQNFITSPDTAGVENREGAREFFIDGGVIEA
ncbi:MAG: DNA replication/repair protein RecF [Candidatus Krumholzibacteriota bacterium]|nr:DNA replication/repair protein RecF [Candidatus Krumholzibacteriota bacterium]